MTTDDALTILHRRYVIRDPELARLLEQERRRGDTACRLYGFAFRLAAMGAATTAAGIAAALWPASALIFAGGSALLIAGILGCISDFLER